MIFNELIEKNKAILEVSVDLKIYFIYTVYMFTRIV